MTTIALRRFDELREKPWRFRHWDTQRILECAIYRASDGGLEVRTSYSRTEVVQHERSRFVWMAHWIARGWRRRIIATGEFEQL